MKARAFDVVRGAGWLSALWKGVYWFTDYPSLDQLYWPTDMAGGSAALDTYLGALILSSGSGSTAGTKQAWKQPVFWPVTLTWDKVRRFKTRVKYSSAVALAGGKLWVCIGNTPVGLQSGVGFYVDDSKDIYCQVNDGGAVPTSSLVGSITGDSWTATLEVELIPGVHAKFWIDDILVATLTSDLPSGSAASAQLIHHLGVYTPGDSTVRKCAASYWAFMQEP